MSNRKHQVAAAGSGGHSSSDSEDDKPLGQLAAVTTAARHKAELEQYHVEYAAYERRVARREALIHDIAGVQDEMECLKDKGKRIPSKMTKEFKELGKKFTALKEECAAEGARLDKLWTEVFGPRELAAERPKLAKMGLLAPSAKKKVAADVDAVSEELDAPSEETERRQLESCAEAEKQYMKQQAEKDAEKVADAAGDAGAEAAKKVVEAGGDAAAADVAEKVAETGGDEAAEEAKKVAEVVGDAAAAEAK